MSNNNIDTYNDNDQKNKPKLKKTNKKYFSIFDILIGFIMVGAIFYFIMLGTGNLSLDGLSEDNANISTAKISTVAKKVITDNLKSPSSAKFSRLDISSNSDGSYTVTGYVDADNSFGSNIRNNFSVDVTIKTDNSFTYKNLVFD